MTIYITGASGYLGKSLAYHFAEQGNKVIALCRTKNFDHPNIQFSKFSLGKPLEKGLPKANACIHCAYDLRAVKWPNIYKINVEGTQKLIDDLNELGCDQLLHISSMSAYPNCQSDYGKAKLLIEELVDKANGISVRPGLIYGGSNEGLIGKLSAIANKLPLLPLIGLGNQPLYLAKIEVVIKCIDDLLNNQLEIPKEAVSLAAPTASSLKKILQELSGEKNLHFVPIFWQLPWGGLKLLEQLSLSPPFKSDSIKGLVFPNPNPNFDFVIENNIAFPSEL